MNRLLVIASLCGVLLSSAGTVHALDWYALGFYCSNCTTPGNHNRLFDDGLHGDGAAGDGVYGANIVSDLPAGRYLWSATLDPIVTGWPQCGCSNVQYAFVWTTGPGDVVHFAFDTRGNGWIPLNGAASDHDAPAPAPLEAGIDYGCCVRFGTPSQVAAASPNGTIWEAIALIPAAGNHRYFFRTTDDAVRFTPSYNRACDCSFDEEPGGIFTTAAPNLYVRLQFDRAVGRMRAEILGPTPTNASTWGRIKATYR